MSVRKIKQTHKGGKAYFLTHFPGDNKYVITCLATNAIDQVQRADEIAVFSDENKALEYWNCNIDV